MGLSRPFWGCRTLTNFGQSQIDHGPIACEVAPNRTEGEGMLRGVRLRRGLIVTASITGFLVSLLGLPTLPEALAATLANPITYVYDDIGRIEAVIDTTQTNGLATYVYDPVGNL